MIEIANTSNNHLLFFSFSREPPVKHLPAYHWKEPTGTEPNLTEEHDSHCSQGQQRLKRSWEHSPITLPAQALSPFLVPGTSLWAHQTSLTWTMTTQITLTNQRDKHMGTPPPGVPEPVYRPSLIWTRPLCPLELLLFVLWVCPHTASTLSCLP